MKKTILLFILLPLLFSAKASDTLTVRQAFDFNIGDTLDYESHILARYFPAYLNYEGYSYSRIVVTGKSYSTDSLTLTYLYNIQSTGNATIDSQVLSHLDTNIIEFDTTLTTYLPIFVGYSFQAGIDSNALLYNISRGLTTDNACTHQYTQTLGLTFAERYEGNIVDGLLTYDTTLIYYNKGGVGHGTPYYNQYRYLHLGLSNIETHASIHLYPNPDIFHLTYTEASQRNTHLIITDLLGQQVYSSSITETESTHDISGLPTGIYTWRLSTEQGTIKTGKVIKQ